MNDESSHDIDALMREADLAVSPEEQADLLTRAIALTDASGDDDRGVVLRLWRNNVLQSMRKSRPVFASFAWVLQKYTSGAVDFDEWGEHALLWQFQWVIEDAMMFPAVGLVEIERMIEQMEGIFRGLGLTLEPVAAMRYGLAAHRHGRAGAEAEYARWLSSETGPLTDCELCRTAIRVQHLTAVGQHDRAVAEGHTALESDESCSHHPRHLLTEMLEPLLRTGDVDAAMRAHLRARRALRRHPEEIHWVSMHLSVLARAGDLDRALTLLEETLPALDDPATPWWELLYCGRAALVLRLAHEAGHGDRAIITPAGPRGRARDLCVELQQRARVLAEQFDERNATDHWSGWLESLADASCDDLPALPSAGAWVPVEPQPEIPEDPSLRTATVAELVERLGTLRRFGGTEQRWALCREWQRRVGAREAGDEAEEGSVHDEGDLAAAVAMQTPMLTADQRVEWLERAAALHREAGDEAEAAIDEQQIAVLREDADAVRAAVGKVDATGSTTQRARVRLYPQWLAAEPADVDTRLREVVALPVEADSPHELRAAHLLAFIELEQTDGLDEERLLEPGELPGVRTFVAFKRAQLTAETGEFEEARDVAAEGVRTAEQAGELQALSRGLMSLSRLCEITERWEEAEQAAARSARIAARIGEWGLLADGQHMLAGLLARQGRFDEAAEGAEATLGQLDRVREEGQPWGPRERDALNGLLDVTAAVSAELDDPARARSLWQRLTDDPTADHGLATRALLQLGELAKADDDALAAASHLRAAADRAQRAQLLGEWAAAVIALPMPLCETDGPEAAKSAVEQAELVIDHIEAHADAAGLTPSDIEDMRLDLADTRVRVLALVGEPAAALALVDDLAAEFVARERFGDELSTKQVQVALLLDLGRHDDARTAIEGLMMRLRDLGGPEEAMMGTVAMVAQVLHDAGDVQRAERLWQEYGPGEDA